MHAQNFPLPLLHPVITFLFFLITSSLSYGQENEQYTTCNSSYSCGNIQNIGFPFWGGDRPQECGLPEFELECEANEDPVIKIDNHNFRVRAINKDTRTMRIARKDLEEDVCPDSFGNTTLNDALFHYGPDLHAFVLLYGCPFSIPSEWKNFSFICNNTGDSSLGFYPDESFSSFWGPKYPSCEFKVVVPVVIKEFEQFENQGSTKISELLKQGFDVVYNKSIECMACERSRGLCWLDTDTRKQTCLCQDRTYSYYCGYVPDQGTKRDIRVKVAVGVGATAFTAVVACVIFVLYHRRQKKSQAGSSLISRSILSYPSSTTDPAKASHYFGAHVFDYNELEEATNSFDSNKELGEGGFGTVYLGKLRDGRDVAVKRLYENNYKRVEQFRNEIEILTRLRHRNLVTLYGCTSRHCRELLLVYEYIPNGTVADHLHGECSKPGSLSWSTRMSIAIETASALAFLHNSDVIHRDVKTNNILLDSTFCVKVADFGLSRLFPTDVTHVSTAPQGTPGYVDPQYHECYQLTSKSDVYSFGVVLIELISSLPAVDICRHRHEINLSNMAINKIQSNALHELVDSNLCFSSNDKVKLMITAVAELAFQCLQNDRDLRPSMPEVLEALLGIQSMDKTATEIGKPSPGDDAGLLKNHPLSHSPDSVISKWTSSSSSTTTASSTG
ncbi:LEAF RUST 10 DISEASE-RESISTANCE LOCUS RECEPTOR-LIKE PROTEIN KINASE-like 1.2 isoform X1 [Lycium barbarum]|uniref:LEAF RUST 10 DISEASE-RESISTANCE LOCUS RECEPTOR-LIKE PROTEIN KINASE-like 1.2 isoform X1 n=1 Tax=Lycium barbarum TaxID=112863 RepID=UPI00293E0C90|nr:LEAF RUST 10 DISEASE-RESISTANCE LOCUS RECEPTOR-LIKE PROTEIN KINASE-like 1.2 isoform X1 [Lycium barbarum]